MACRVDNHNTTVPEISPFKSLAMIEEAIMFNLLHIEAIQNCKIAHYAAPACKGFIVVFGYHFFHLTGVGSHNSKTMLK